MIPWVHMHVWPSGDAFPCCIADSGQPVGRYGQQSIAEIWNSPKYRAIRRNMLTGKPSEECKRCYFLEKNANTYTLRRMANEQFAHHWEKVAATKEDGTAPAVNMAYFDIRFSNLCNFRCQTCGPDLSSAWYEDHLKMRGNSSDPKVIRIDRSEEFWQELEPLLMGVEQCYFAGGEPLLCEEHYRILDFWLERGKLDAGINYTTNFSLLQFRGKSALDYWKKFPKVRISASLDAAGPRAEYLRKGTEWARIVANRKAMLERCPEVYFEITPTISAYNVQHFPDFHLEWVEQGLLEIDHIRLNVLSIPSYMGVAILPRRLKRAAAEKYRRTRDILVNRAIQRNKPHHRVQADYGSILDILESPDLALPKLVPLRRAFKDRVALMDGIRKENLLRAFPELEGLRV